MANKRYKRAVQTGGVNPPEGIRRTPTRSRAGYDFAPRTLSWINPAIRARVGIAINEDSAGVFRTIGLASVNRVRA
jgi:hypothetical protein